jgi:hypothetical protein
MSLSKDFPCLSDTGDNPAGNQPRSHNMITFFDFSAPRTYFFNCKGSFMACHNGQRYFYISQQIAQIRMTAAGVDIPDKCLLFLWRFQFKFFDAVGFLYLIPDVYRQSPVRMSDVFFYSRI